ncbi:unnamed protein product, partial [Prorocentrum cordatum]
AAGGARGRRRAELPGGGAATQSAGRALRAGVGGECLRREAAAPAVGCGAASAAVGTSSPLADSRPCASAAAPAQLPAPGPQCPRVDVRFMVRFDTRPGQEVNLVGSCDLLGCWDVGKSVHMAWTEGNVWAGKVAFCVSSEGKFELSLSKTSGATAIPRRVLFVPKGHQMTSQTEATSPRIGVRSCGGPCRGRERDVEGLVRCQTVPSHANNKSSCWNAPCLRSGSGPHREESRLLERLDCWGRGG